MKKVVINNSEGGSFSLSQEAIFWMNNVAKTRNISVEYKSPCLFISREDPLLVECVETLGKIANAEGSKLIVLEIPDDVEYTIQTDDDSGDEFIVEKHRVWYPKKQRLSDTQVTLSMKV
jgi:hypothetical protein